MCFQVYVAKMFFGYGICFDIRVNRLFRHANGRSYYILQFEKPEYYGEDRAPSQRAMSISELSPELIADVFSISIASMRADLPCIGGCDDVKSGIFEDKLALKKKKN